MWDIEPADLFLGPEKWNALKQDIQKFGLRNSEVTALAPTAASSVRMGNNDMHEPYTRNIYIRQNIAGSIQIVNRHLVNELVELGVWNQQLCNQIISNDGSVLGIPEIPTEIQERYRTVYELDWKQLIDMMAERSPFISQTSSYNHYTTYEETGPTAFTQKIIYAWKKKLKTLSYYMHTETATTARKELGGISSQKSQQPALEIKLQEPIIPILKPTQTPMQPIEEVISIEQILVDGVQEEVKILADGTVCRMEEGCIECQA